MSAIFETEFRDLPIGDGDRMAKASSLKITMLAIADHANDEGESSYPGLTRLELKTGLSRQGLVGIIAACKHNGLLGISEQKSKIGTNNYIINTTCFPRLIDKDDQRLLVKPLDQSSHLTSTSQATLPEVVKSLDLNHQLTTNKPPTKRGDIVDGMLHFQALGQKQERQSEIYQTIREKLSEMLNLNFPGYGENRDFDAVYRRIEQDGRSVEQFCRWALDNLKDADVRWLALKAANLWSQWPQAFKATTTIKQADGNGFYI